MRGALAGHGALAGASRHHAAELEGLGQRGSVGWMGPGRDTPEQVHRSALRSSVRAPTVRASSASAGAAWWAWISLPNPDPNPNPCPAPLAARLPCMHGPPCSCSCAHAGSHRQSSSLNPCRAGVRDARLGARGARAGQLAERGAGPLPGVHAPAAPGCQLHSHQVGAAAAGCWHCCCCWLLALLMSAVAMGCAHSRPCA